MRILFAISIAAFLALLWASISTAQHIRRAKARRKLLEEFAEERAARRAEPPSGFAPVKILPVPELASAPKPIAAPPLPQAEAVIPPPPFPEVTPATHFEPRWPLARHRASSAAVPIYVEPAAISEAKPELEPAPQITTPLTPYTKRPPASVPTRPDYAYFNENMGDLSDPEPGGSRLSLQRLKDRFRQS